VKWRGFVYGVFIAGGRAAGIVVLLLMELFLHTWRFRITWMIVYSRVFPKAG